MTIGERIKAKRRELHLTQEELAKRAGVAVNSIRLYESGKNEPKRENLNKIANVLETTAEYLAIGSYSGSDAVAEDNVELLVRQFRRIIEPKLKSATAKDDAIVAASNDPTLSGYGINTDKVFSFIQNSLNNLSSQIDLIFPDDPKEE